MTSKVVVNIWPEVTAALRNLRKYDTRYNAGHQFYVRQQIAAYEAQGYSVQPNVSFLASKTPTRAVQDFVASKGGLPNFGIEVKTFPSLPSSASVGPDAGFSPNQLTVYPDVERETAFPVGQNASVAGFALGSRIGYGQPIIRFQVIGYGPRPE